MGAGIFSNQKISRVICLGVFCMPAPAEVRIQWRGCVGWVELFAKPITGDHANAIERWKQGTGAAHRVRDVDGLGRPRVTVLAADASRLDSRAIAFFVPSRQAISLNHFVPVHDNNAYVSAP
jgi:hypothetical protein